MSVGALLQVLSGLLAVAASGLLTYRVWTTPPPVKLEPAVYAPVAIKAPPTGDVSESESPANGFILVVESQPEASTLSVNGVENGETPASVNLDCKPGSAVSLTLTHPGYTTLEHTVTCKKDVMLVLDARLSRHKR